MLANSQPELGSLAREILVIALLLRQGVLHQARYVRQELVWPSLYETDEGAAYLTTHVVTGSGGEEEEMLQEVVYRVEHGLRLSRREDVDGRECLNPNLRRGASGCLDKLGEQKVEWSLAVVFPFKRLGVVFAYFGHRRHGALLGLAANLTRLVAHHLQEVRQELGPAKQPAALDELRGNVARVAPYL